MVRGRAMANIERATRAAAVGTPWPLPGQAAAHAATPGEGMATGDGPETGLWIVCTNRNEPRCSNKVWLVTREDRHSACWAMSDRPDRTASFSVTLAGRRPQSLAFGDPCGAAGIDPVTQPSSGAPMPFKARCGPLR